MSVNINNPEKASINILPETSMPEWMDSFLLAQFSEEQGWVRLSQGEPSYLILHHPTSQKTHFFFQETTGYHRNRVLEWRGTLAEESITKLQKGGLQNCANLSQINRRNPFKGMDLIRVPSKSEILDLFQSIHTSLQDISLLVDYIKSPYTPEAENVLRACIKELEKEKGQNFLLEIMHKETDTLLLQHLFLLELDLSDKEFVRKWLRASPDDSFLGYIAQAFDPAWSEEWEKEEHNPFLKSIQEGRVKSALFYIEQGFNINKVLLHKCRFFSYTTFSLQIFSRHPYNGCVA